MPGPGDFLDLPRSSAREDHMTNRRKSQLLTTVEAAEVLRLKKHTLENMRSQGKGPIFMKLGGRVFYHRADLRAWCAQARRRSSSGEKP
jgi:excisionase family DNA binding protein